MGDIHINNGSWQSIQNLYVNVGSWNAAKRAYIHNGSGWVLAWENEITETFAFSAGQTYQNTTLCTTNRCHWTLVAGEHPSLDTNHFGLWIPGNGSASGQTIGTTLNGRTIASLKVTLGLGWSYSGRYNGDGIPSRVSLWGAAYSSIPGSFSSAGLTYLGTLAWYPATSDYTSGFATVTQAQLGIDPPTQGNRYPQVRADIDFTSQLSSTARTNLTNGSIQSFVLSQYNYLGVKQNYTYYASYTEPGETYTTSGIPATGDANAFRVKVTHTG